MENRYFAYRRAAVWQVLRSKASDQDKLEHLAALGERDTNRAWRRGYRQGLQKPSAVRAGVLRRVVKRKTN